MEMKKKIAFQFNWSSLLLTCRRKKKMRKYTQIKTYLKI